MLTNNFLIDHGSIRSKHSIALSSSPSKSNRSHTHVPSLPPPIITPSVDDIRNRPVSWISQSSATSANTTSTISPGGHMFDQALFDEFPSVPQDLPQIPFPTTAPALPRASLDPQSYMSRSATLPLRSRRHSGHKLG